LIEKAEDASSADLPGTGQQYTKMPKKWTVGENRSFETAYKDANLTQRINTAISKIRADLRKVGVIT
jgi:hypothetical protein